MKIVIPGGSGFLGRNLRDRLVARGDTVIVLTRGNPATGQGWEALHWDGATVGDWAHSLEGADAVVHLSGKNVDCRPTRRNLAELISSRVDPVRALGQAWLGTTTPPPVWVQMSSLARYGDAGETTITEDTAPFADGPPQMMRVCKEWEAAFAAATTQVPRTVLLRPSIGIGGSGDRAARRLMWLTRWGLGGRVGSGEQWVSWVSLVDFMNVLVRAIDDETMNGLYHLTSPNPIRNSEMMATFRKLLGRPFGLASPALFAKVGAFALGTDPALALNGRRAVPARLMTEGYEFELPDFDTAAARAVAEST